MSSELLFINKVIIIFISIPKNLDLWTQNAATARPLKVWVIKASADTNGKNHPSEQNQKRGRLKKKYGKRVK